MIKRMGGEGRKRESGGEGGGGDREWGREEGERREGKGFKII